MSTGAIFVNRDVRRLVSLSQVRLGMSHERFGHALGSSKRTAARWAAGHASPSLSQVRTLARLVYPEDAALAAELAAAASESLESLGIIAPVPAPVAAAVPSPPPAPPLAALVDSVVCAAADALSVPPSTVRTAVLAAFRRSQEMRLTSEQIIAALEPLPVDRGKVSP
jgi:hypothetical protein